MPKSTKVRPRASGTAELLQGPHSGQQLAGSSGRTATAEPATGRTVSATPPVGEPDGGTAASLYPVKAALEQSRSRRIPKSITRARIDPHHEHTTTFLSPEDNLAEKNKRRVAAGRTPVTPDDLLLDEAEVQRRGRALANNMELKAWTKEGLVQERALNSQFPDRPQLRITNGPSLLVRAGEVIKAVGYNDRDSDPSMASTTKPGVTVATGHFATCLGLCLMGDASHLGDRRQPSGVSVMHVFAHNDQAAVERAIREKVAAMRALGMELSAGMAGGVRTDRDSRFNVRSVAMEMLIRGVLADLGVALPAAHDKAGESRDADVQYLAARVDENNQPQLGNILELVEDEPRADGEDAARIRGGPG